MKNGHQTPRILKPSEIEETKAKLRQESDDRLARAKTIGSMTASAYAVDEYLTEQVAASDPIAQYHLGILTFGALATKIVSLENARLVVAEWKQAIGLVEAGIVESVPGELGRWRDHLDFAEKFLAFLECAHGITQETARDPG